MATTVSPVPGPPPSTPAFLDRPGWRSLVVAVSKDPNAKVTVLQFASGDKAPCRCVKVPTTPEAGEAVRREAAVLKALHPRLSGSMAATVPRLLESIPTPEGPAAVSTALPGTPMLTRYHSWGHTSRPLTVAWDLAMSRAWLEGLWSATQDGFGKQDLVAPILDELHCRYEWHDSWRAVARRLERLRTRLRKVPTRLAAAHGDFWFGNVLVQGRGVSGVVDWEAGAVPGQPVRDLLRFALTYALYLDRHTSTGREVAGHPGLVAGVFGVGIEYLVNSNGWFGKLAAAFLRDGFQSLGVPGDLWWDLLLLGVADLAVTADDPHYGAGHLTLLRRLLQ